MKSHPTRPIQDRQNENPTGTANCPDEAAEDEFDTPHELEDPSDLDQLDADDDRWDAFLADEDELDPTPEPGDFWHDID